MRIRRRGDNQRLHCDELQRRDGEYRLSLVAAGGTVVAGATLAVRG
jgi:hypothetical protein